MQALQGGNIGRNQSCLSHVMCAAAKPAAHDRRTFQFTNALGSLGSRDKLGWTQSVTHKI